MAALGIASKLKPIQSVEPNNLARILQGVSYPQDGGLYVLDRERNAWRIVGHVRSFNTDSRYDTIQPGGFQSPKICLGPRNLTIDMDVCIEMDSSGYNILCDDHLKTDRSELFFRYDAQASVRFDGAAERIHSRNAVDELLTAELVIADVVMADHIAAV